MTKITFDQRDQTPNDAFFLTTDTTDHLEFFERILKNHDDFVFGDGILEEISAQSNFLFIKNLTTNRIFRYASRSQ